jgi:U3 small nucleolar RNA-associated protein 10
LKTISKSHVEHCDLVENELISLTTELTLKLNENLFRPLFVKLATSLPTMKVESQKVTIYKLTNNLLDKLVSIFTPFYTHLLDTSVKLLQEFLQQRSVSKMLWGQVIDSLRKFMLFDSEDVITKEHCQAIIMPLINQISEILEESKFYHFPLPSI